MNYDDMKKFEKQFTLFLSKQPYFISSCIKKNTQNEWALHINYKKGMSIKDKKFIASELGDVPVSWVENNG